MATGLVHSGRTLKRAVHRSAIMAALAGVAVASACSRNRTSEEIRLALRSPSGEATFMRYPCQPQPVDDFGWRADSLPGIAFRLHPSLERFGRRTPETVSYRARSGRNSVDVRVPLAYEDLQHLSRQLQAYHKEDCSFHDRSATLVSGLREFDYVTTALWPDVGDGRRLIVTIRARTYEELRELRGTLFTMRFPQTARAATIR